VSAELRAALDSALAGSYALVRELEHGGMATVSVGGQKFSFKPIGKDPGAAQ